MQQLNPSEISDLIKQRIDQLEVASQATNEGTIVSVTDGIIRIHGLTEVQYGEMIRSTARVPSRRPRPTRLKRLLQA
jgi:F-type H+-transporting ATPase subunit alpha